MERWQVKVWGTHERVDPGAASVPEAKTTTQVKSDGSGVSGDEASVIPGWETWDPQDSNLPGIFISVFVTEQGDID